MAAASGRANLRISDPTDASKIVAEVKAYAEANPDLDVIRADSCWNLGVFADDSPHKSLLDDVVSDRPVYLTSQTGHSAWVNSTALAMAGIDSETPQTESFLFDVDPVTGEPSGTVREYAMGAVDQVLAPTPAVRVAPELASVLSDFNSYGFTGLKAAEGEREWVESAVLLDRQGELTARLFPSWHWNTHYSATDISTEEETILAWRDFKSHLVSPRHVKVFYDGAPDSYTALMFDDYVGRPGDQGRSHLPRGDFLEAFLRFNKLGLGVIVHVIGDRGASEVVDLFAEVRKRNGDNGALLHLSHAWTTRPEDFARLAQISDTCADFSPVLAYPAPEIRGSFVPPLGEDRYQRFFNVRSAIESGVSVGFGSDWPAALIPEPNAFHQMQSWITRTDPHEPDGETLNPDQAITLEQAIRGFTMGGAACLGFGWSDRIGSIQTGKQADFIVLDRNIFDQPIHNLYKTEVELTVLDGEPVHEA